MEVARKLPKFSLLSQIENVSRLHDLGIEGKPFVCFSRNSCGLVSHLMIFELNLIKLFTVFFYSHSIPSRLILNLFDSSTDERFINTNNEIKIAIERM